MKDKFPNGLRSAMKAAGIGPTALAELINESKQNVSRWANGERKLEPAVAKRIAPHLKVDATQLLLIESGDQEKRARIIAELPALKTDDLREILSQAAAILADRAS